ncbi:MAG: flagellar hook-basal body complex protein FliE [Gammaproteobacteria bacterium]|nr:flagellar hook-basal body complex protein FliE [Gammaproteobacteria bacterium]
MNGVTDRVDINQLLMQMREIRSQVDAQPVRTELQGSVDSANVVNDSNRTSFGDVLKSAVNSVNETQQKSSELQRAFEMGDPQVDITQVMIQMQKASVSFEAMNQVRNRLVSAYQDIMNMPI